MLVKISKEFDRIWGSNGQKHTQKQPKIVLSAAVKIFDIWKLGNYISDIKWNLYMRYKPRYVLTPTPLVYQKMRLSIRGDREGRSREGTLKLLVKVWLKFERSFGDLLHTNKQKMWLRWLLACLLIITSPSTSSYSSYSFSLSFFGHWHSFTCNRPTKSFQPSQKLARLGLSIPFLVT